MQQYQRDFIRFALTTGVLRFGEFVLKSGRHSPYFFDTGRFNSGAGLLALGQAYAQAIIAANINFDMLYGPAYKGIPLVASTSVVLAEHHQIDTPYAFNRKEAKDHGERGLIVGSNLQGRVLILDDVISAGTSLRESISIIHSHKATPVGVVIALDRQEYLSTTSQPSIKSNNELDLPIISIIKFIDLVAYLTELPEYAENLQRMRAYQSQYVEVGLAN